MVQHADDNGYWIILISTFIPKLVTAVTTVLPSQQNLEKDCTHLIIPDPPVAPCHHYNIKKRSTGTINKKLEGKSNVHILFQKGVEYPCQFNFNFTFRYFTRPVGRWGAQGARAPPS